MPRKTISWRTRKKVMRCEHREYVNCPRCGLEDDCLHEFNNEGECGPEECPFFNEKTNRWRKEPKDPWEDE